MWGPQLRGPQLCAHCGGVRCLGVMVAGGSSPLLCVRRWLCQACSAAVALQACDQQLRPVRRNACGMPKLAGSATTSSDGDGGDVHRARGWVPARAMRTRDRPICELPPPVGGPGHSRPRFIISLPLGFVGEDDAHVKAEDGVLLRVRDEEHAADEDRARRALHRRLTLVITVTPRIGAARRLHLVTSRKLLPPDANFIQVVADVNVVAVASQCDWVRMPLPSIDLPRRDRTIAVAAEAPARRAVS